MDAANVLRERLNNKKRPDRDIQMKYFLYEVVLPLLLVVLVYFPGGVTVLRNEIHLFEKVFSSGDLLGIGVLILINSYVELDKAERERGLDAFGFAKGVILVSAIVIFTTYLFIKVAALHFNYEEAQLPSYITSDAYTSMACLIYTALIGAVSRWLTYRLKNSIKSGQASSGGVASVIASGGQKP